MKKALWKNTELARSDDCVMVEGNAYFPMTAVNMQYLRPSPTHTHCGWKGEASYYHLDIDGTMNQDAAWFYPEPYAAAKAIKDHIAFWKGVEVIEEA